MEEMILLEIFLVQTKKTLVRCGAVCKRWENLIQENSSSLTSATARLIDQGSLILHKELGPEMTTTTFSRFDSKGRLLDEHTIDSESIFGPLQMNINASSRNPVVLYYTIKEQKQYCRCYHVYNPLTRHHTDIPPITKNIKSSCIYPFPSCLGYAPSSEKDGSRHFKFVVAYFRKTDRSSPLNIVFSTFDSETGVWETKQPNLSLFNSKTGIWETLQPESDHLKIAEARTWVCGNYRDKCPSSVFLDGDLFWLRKSCFLAFRLKTWTARRIELPPLYGILGDGCFWESDGCFWESDGRLKYCQIHQTPLPGYELSIWALDEPLVNDGGNKWRKVFGLSKDALDSIHVQAGITVRYYGEDTRVTAFDEDEGIIHLHARQSGGLFSYDIWKKSASHISANSYSKRRRLLGICQVE